MICVARVADEQRSGSGGVIVRTRARLIRQRSEEGFWTLTPSAVRHHRSNEMEIILTVGSLLAIWVVVIWGASYFNQNVK